MGKPYPVTEHPHKPNNLFAKPCVSGYDSHYVIVKKESGLNYIPFKPGDNPNEKLNYDEIVVFKKSQILPRYIIYYEK